MKLTVDIPATVEQMQAAGELMDDVMKHPDFSSRLPTIVACVTVWKALKDANDQQRKEWLDSMAREHIAIYHNGDGEACGDNCDYDYGAQ